MAAFKLRSAFLHASIYCLTKRQATTFIGYHDSFACCDRPNIKGSSAWNCNGNNVPLFSSKAPQREAASPVPFISHFRLCYCHLVSSRRIHPRRHEQIAVGSCPTTYRQVAVSLSACPPRSQVSWKKSILSHPREVVVQEHQDSSFLPSAARSNRPLGPLLTFRIALLSLSRGERYQQIQNKLTSTSLPCGRLLDQAYIVLYLHDDRYEYYGWFRQHMKMQLWIAICQPLPPASTKAINMIRLWRFVSTSNMCIPG